MTLNHVCMWVDGEWKRVTAEEASAIHPGGTVSARNGLFFCELCGQYVTLTNGFIRGRYFKHSAYEASKNCPERTFGSGYRVDLEPKKYCMPLRMRLVNNRYIFELGMISVPDDILNQSKNGYIEIIDGYKNLYKYSLERIENNTTTYLYAGDKPSSVYKLNYSGVSGALVSFWADKVVGVDSKGSLFDKETGKKLPYDADVKVGCHYYLLTQRYVYANSEHVKINKLPINNNNWGIWKLYEVTANDYSEESAKFFLNLHCRLTENPIELLPIWPVVVENPYLLFHNSDYMYMYIKGNANIKAFPYTQIQKNNSLIKFCCNERQQLISAGRSEVLKYTYLWKKPLTMTAKMPEVKVTDIKGNELLKTEYDALPKDKCLIIVAEFDGKIEIFHDEFCEIQFNLSAGKRLQITDVNYGLKIIIKQGIDIVRKIIFSKKEVKSKSVINEADFVNLLDSQRGETVPIPHSFGAIISKYNKYPLIRKWIYCAIRNKKINRKSLLILRQYL